MPVRTDHAAIFHDLHRGPDLLVLANVWDGGSARLVESLGARALATTSAGVAWAHGYPDGDALPVERLAETVALIARVSSLPLTADVEGGYSDDPASVAGMIARVVDAGAVGINIEDGAGSPDLLAAKIGAAKEAARGLGVDLFVNARTDVFLRGLVAEEARIEETLARAARYRAAGADGLFVPGILAAADIRTVAAEAGLPLNVLARPGVPPAAELAELGARRLSAGSGVLQSLFGRAAALTRDFLREGRSDPLADGAMSHAQINGLLGAGPTRP